MRKQKRTALLVASLLAAANRSAQAQYSQPGTINGTLTFGSGTPSAPGTVTNLGTLAGGAGNDATILLSYGAASGSPTPTYDVYKRCPSGSGSYSLAITLTSSLTPTLTTLTDGQTCDVQVTAINSQGTGSAVTLSAIPVNALAGPPVSLGTLSGAANTIVLDWGAPTSPAAQPAGTSYDVYDRLTGSGSYTLALSGSNSTTQTLTGITANVDIEVAQVNPIGIGAVATLTNVPPNGGSVASCSQTAYSSYSVINAELSDCAMLPIAVYSGLTQPGSTYYSNGTLTVAQAEAQMDANGQDVYFNFPSAIGGTDTGLVALAGQSMWVLAGAASMSLTNTGTLSISNSDSIASASGASAYLLGWNEADEPACGDSTTWGTAPYDPSIVPSSLATLNAQDTTRANFVNMLFNVNGVYNTSTCNTNLLAAGAASVIGSADVYPESYPYLAGVMANSSNTQGNWTSGQPFDSLFITNANDQWIHQMKPSGPNWGFMENGADIFNGNYTSITASVTSGSTTITLVPAFAAQQFSALWLKAPDGVTGSNGMTITGTGLPAGDHLVSVTNGTTAVLSAAATATVSSGAFALSGGATVGAGPTTSDCLTGLNTSTSPSGTWTAGFCLASGAELGASPSQTNAEAWANILSGMLGEQIFCDGSNTDGFCIGDSTHGGTRSTIAWNNQLAVDQTILTFAPIINGGTLTDCSMQAFNYATSPGVLGTISACTSGSLHLNTSSGAAIAAVWQCPTALGCSGNAVVVDRAFWSGVSANDHITVASTGTLPAPLASATTYYAKKKAPGLIELEASSGGTVIQLTGAATGTLTLTDTSASVTSATAITTVLAQAETLACVQNDRRATATVASVTFTGLTGTGHVVLDSGSVYGTSSQLGSTVSETSGVFSMTLGTGTGGDGEDPNSYETRCAAFY